MIVATSISGLDDSASRPRPDFPAGSRLARLQASGVLRVGVFNDIPGFAWVDANGKRSGVDIGVAKLIAQAIFGGTTVTAGEHIDFIDVGVAERDTICSDGRADMVIAAYVITEERRKHVDFAGAYFGSHIGFMKRKDKVLDLDNGVVVVIDGASTADYVYEAKLGSRVIAVHTTQAMCDALVNGDADYGVDAAVCIENALAAPETPAGLERAREVGPFQSWGVAVAKGDEELRAFTEHRLDEIVEAGSVLALAAHYGH